MAKAKKIIVTQTESIIIHRHLKLDKGTEPAEDLITRIVTEAKVEEWVAKKFVDAWRWNHRGETNTEADTQTEPENYFEQRPLPIPTAVNSSSGGEGTGKVAQIIAYAAQGKSVAEIIALGYNKSTVYRQVGEWKKREKALKELAADAK